MQTNNKNEEFQIKMDWGILFLLFAFAWAIRLIGLDWGYLHGDERVNQAAKALAGQLVPDQHFYPPLMHYLAAVLYGVFYVVGRVIGLWSDTGGFRAQYFEDPTDFYLIARALTGAFSALMAPLFYRIGRVLGFGRGESIFIALFAVLAPISIYLSYIFKGDVAVATSAVLMTLLMIRKVQSPSLVRIDIGLGIAAVLGVSFKHSFVLLLGPMALAYIIVLSLQIGIRPTLLSVLRIFVTGLILWPPLNIGIILDFDNFLKFQEIQSVMSISEGGVFFASVGQMVRTSMNWQIGITLFMPYAFLLFPIFAVGADRPAILIGLWVATIVSMLGVAYLVGLRQPEQLWVAHFMLLQLFGAVSIACLHRISRSVGTLAAALVLAMSLMGNISIWQQTIVRPLNQDVVAYIENTYPDRRIVSNLDLPIQQTREAQDYEWARVTRTAEKYDLVMPDIAPERRIPAGRPDSYFVVPMPEVMYGLEGTTDADMEGSIAPFAWPPQEVDWSLANWLADGVDMFVVSDLPGWMQKHNAPVLKAFYEELNEHCEVVEVFAQRKPLFLERDTSILDCRGADLG